MRYVWHFFVGQLLFAGFVTFWNYLTSKVSVDNLEESSKKLGNPHWKLEEQCELMSSDTIELEIRKRELAISENEALDAIYTRKYSKIAEPLYKMRRRESELYEKEIEKLHKREDTVWYRIKSTIFDRSDINLGDEAEENIKKNNRRFFRKKNKLEKKSFQFFLG